MDKDNKLSPREDQEKVHVRVESWQWDAQPSRRFTWKHGVALVMLITVAILFVFGFLLVAGVVLIVGLLINLLLYIFKKLA